MKTLIKNPRTALTLKTVRFEAVIDNSDADTIALALILEQISRGPRTALLELAQVEFDEQQYTDALCYAVSYACDRASAVKISAELRAELAELENLGIFGDFVELTKTLALELARKFTASELAAQVAVKLANTEEFVNISNFGTMAAD